eukprot:TRINITY_DN22884_c0_g1_i1.p1 TRINITY_DN22884_c0_g1~~TRINITY_DN22884_c0_g1_i1.p1  ORF type:complete len:542 (+),score=90.75 TRINITY_DN22884_c0_g1_i1:191-1816(+)
MSLVLMLVLMTLRAAVEGTSENCMSGSKECSTDPEVFFLQSLLATEEHNPAWLMHEVKSLAKQLNSTSHNSTSSLSKLLAVLDASSASGGAGDIWGSLVNISREVFSMLTSDIQEDQAALDRRREQFNRCDDQPAENYENLLADVKRLQDSVTDLEQRTQAEQSGDIHYDFGRTISSTATETSSKKFALESRMEQYNVMLEALTSAQANLTVAEAALKQAEKSHGELNTKCQCDAKETFDEELQETRVRMEGRKNEEHIAQLLGCIGRQPSFDLRNQCLQQGRSPSRLPALMRTEFDLPAGTYCSRWIERPLVARAGGNVAGSISPLTSVDACKQACDRNPNCNSFSLCEKGPSGCWMKHKVITSSDATVRSRYALERRSCRTWYKDTITTHPGEECWSSHGCRSEGSSSCNWCGGDNWYCCNAARKYGPGDKCANVDFFSSAKYHQCAKEKTSAPNQGGSSATVWFGPLYTDISGTGIGGSAEGSVDGCKYRCLIDPRCQAIQYSSRERYNGDNCFLFDNQRDDGTQYRSFEIYKLHRRG